MEFYNKMQPDKPENSICEVRKGMVDIADREELTFRPGNEELIFRS